MCILRIEQKKELSVVDDFSFVIFHVEEEYFFRDCVTCARTLATFELTRNLRGD